MEKYDANSIETLDFVTAIRKRIEMYMGSADNQGILQCIREVISNSIDEFSIGYGNKIEITVDTQKNIFSCRDYARSIPFGKRTDGSEAMIATFMNPHTGGKFNDKQYGAAVIGMNGTGIKGVALSSEDFCARSYRDGKCAELILHRGEKKKYEVTSSKEPQGTYIEFCPSADVYHLEEIHMSFKDICQMCEDWSYLNKGLTFVLTDIINNKTVTYYSKNGVSDFIRAKLKSTIQKEPFVYYTEDNEGNKMEIAFLWGSKNEMSFVFTNGLHNLNGGTSLTGAKTAITRTMNSLAGEKFTGDFVRNNLCYVINAKVPHASFSDQTKMRVNNGSLKPLADKAFTEALKQFSTTHRDEFEKVLSLLTKINKANLAAEREYNAVLNHEKEMTVAAKKKFITSDKLREARVLGPESTLVVVEGDSAGGSISTGRQKAENGDHIGILMLRGKAINALANPIEKVLENEEVKLLLQALGLIYGQRYNSKKLRYGKIAISSDADFDGAHVGLLVMSILQKLCPEFIQEGRLYWLKAPICKLDCKGKTWYYYSEDEINNRSQKEGNIVFYKGLGQMSPKDLQESLFNSKYQHLERLIPSEEGINALLSLMGEEVEPRKEFVQQIDFGGFEL